MKKLKLSILYTLALFFVVGVIYSSFYFFTHEHSPKYTDCGIIKSKSQDEVIIKYGTKTELFLNVEFDKAGFKSVEANPTTYFKYNIGDRICWDLKIPQTDNHYILMMLGAMVVVACSIALGIYFIYWLVKNLC